MTIRNVVRWLGGALAVLGLLLLTAGNSAAQTSTGTIRGTITGADGKGLSGAEIVAKNISSGVERSTTSRVDGGYTLAGMVPSTYQLTVRHIGSGAQARQVVVQIGATQVQDFMLEEKAIEVQELVVQAPPPVVETRTSEVATNVTQEQINNLPTSNRNIFDLAALAPGVVTQNDQIGTTRRTFSSGASSADPRGADQINVFFDGASYKNDLLRGGVVGQDRSRGNPFPRNAVQEFRVITQNYKAEYQKSSSGIISATTKSGGNIWAGNFFFGYQNKGLVALDTFQRAAKAGNPSFKKPDYTRYQVGFSAGGPIIRNKLHVFASYEGNYQDRTSRVAISPPTGFPVVDTFNLTSLNGNFGSPFRESLFFGKLSYAASNNSSLEFSVDQRHETDIRDFGSLFGVTDHALKNSNGLDNNVSTGRLKYNIFKGPWLNEAMVSYQRYHDQSSPHQPGGATFFFCCNFTAWTGPAVTTQDFLQKRLAFRNDLTYSGFRAGGQHIIKTGVGVDLLNYDILKRNSENPLFVLTDADSFKTPEHVEFQFGNPNYSNKNTQIGAYLQDDWSPTSRLTLNAGIRWDYETNMVNTKYKTPQDVVDSLTKYDTLLFIPLNPNKYFTDGTKRSNFTGAFQPRLGFSYQLDKAGKTTIFGGWGLFYDRSVQDVVQQEREALQHPSYRINFKRFPADSSDPTKVAWDPTLVGKTPSQILAQVGGIANNREVKLLPNDLRPPKSSQFSAGIRQLLGSWALQATYTGTRASNVFTFQWANIDFPCGNGSCFTFHSIPGFTNILVGSSQGKAWYDALQVQVDRPYRRSSARFGWGAGLAYTFSKRQTQGFNDDFSFPNARFYPKQVRNDERSRVVANWILDVPYAFGIQFSGLITLGSGAKVDIGDRFNDGTLGNPGTVPQFGGFTPKKYDFIIPGAWAYRNVDVRLRKDFPEFAGTRLGVTLDVFNVFNYQNLGGFNTFNRTDVNFGHANSTVSDPRRFQLGAEYNF